MDRLNSQICTVVKYRLNLINEEQKSESVRNCFRPQTDNLNLTNVKHAKVWKVRFVCPCASGMRAKVGEVLFRLGLEK